MTGRGKKTAMKNSLKTLRQQRGLTQQQLANALDVSRQTIISIENGKYDPSLTLAFKLSRFLGTRIEELFSPD
jgi:putative transcriptional regulator